MLHDYLKVKLERKVRHKPLVLGHITLRIVLCSYCRFKRYNAELALKAMQALKDALGGPCDFFGADGALLER